MREPFNVTVTDHLTRHHGGKEIWREEEVAILHRLYPQADRLEVLKALPMRTWESIVQQATLRHIKRHTIRDTSGIHEALTYTDAVYLRETLHKDPRYAPWDAYKWVQKWIARLPRVQDTERVQEETLVNML